MPATPATPPTAIDAARPGRLEPSQRSLVALLALEVVAFATIGTNFFSLGNALEVLRLSGGIDLSVGSLMGLSAVLFGKFWRDLGLPPAAASALTLVVGAAAGGLNGL